MLNAILFAALGASCQAEFNPPQAGAVFVYQSLDFAAFETVGSAARDGQVNFQLAIAPGTDQPPVDARTEYSTLAGVIPTGNRFMDQSRNLRLPDDAFSQMAQLSEGDSLAFEGRLIARLQGQTYRGQAQVSVRLQGCGPVTTPAGRYDTHRYAVSYPSVGLDPRGQFRVEQVERIVYYAPELGWPVRHDFGSDGSAELIRME